MKLKCNLLVIAIVLCSAFAAHPARAQQSKYLDMLFAPPTAAELDSVYERTAYTPECRDFNVGEVYLEGPGYVVNKVTFTSDGLKQTGLFGYPKAQPAPLAVINHAGFNGFARYDDSRLRQYLERGYAVSVATYRGEAGSAGKSEGAMDVLGDETHDILNLMECALKSGKVDPEKIVMMGVSHGGGLTTSILIHSKRIKAAGVASSPTNLTNEAFKKMASEWRSRPASVEVMLQMLMPREGIARMKKILGVLEQDPTKVQSARFEMFRRSPALFADKITTPFMMYFGGKDPVAYSGDGKLVTDSLAARGIVTKLTVFENRGHAYNPDENENAHKEIIDFFDKQLNRSYNPDFSPEKSGK